MCHRSCLLVLISHMPACCLTQTLLAPWPLYFILLWMNCLHAFVQPWLLRHWSIYTRSDDRNNCYLVFTFSCLIFLMIHFSLHCFSKAFCLFIWITEWCSLQRRVSWCSNVGPNRIFTGWWCFIYLLQLLISIRFNVMLLLNGKGKGYQMLNYCTVLCPVTGSGLQVWKKIIWGEDIYNLWNGRFLSSRNSTGKRSRLHSWLVKSPLHV